MTTYSSAAPASGLGWKLGWRDFDFDSYNWGIYALESGVSAGFAPVSDALNRDGDHRTPHDINILVVKTDMPFVALPCTGYIESHKWTAGGYSGRKLYKPIHSNPQYIGLGDVVWRESTSGPPPVGAYYCVNKAFVKIGEAVPHNDCVANNNCIAGGAPMLYRSFGQTYGNITTTPQSYTLLPYDDVISGCKGLPIGIKPPIAFGSNDCNYILNSMYNIDDMKADTPKREGYPGKVDFCATNPGWCDTTMTVYCAKNPNHSWCDCINTEQRPFWKEIDALLVPAAKGAPLSCKSPFCNARNDVFKTSQMVVDGRSCPDIRYIDQSVKVDGQGNIVRANQTGSIGGDTTTNSNTDNTTNNITNETIMGISSTIFYILLFIFIVVIIVVSMKYSDDEPKRLPQPETV